MKKLNLKLILLVGWNLFFLSCQQQSIISVVVPFTLDHNRMIVDAEMQRSDGSWRAVRMWVDSGNPDFFISETLANDLGIEFSRDSLTTNNGRIDVSPPGGLRIGGMQLKFDSIKTTVLAQPLWLFKTMNIDANLPSTVLRNYQVVLDYPKQQLTLAVPGTHRPRGERLIADIHQQTGIVQIDILIGSDSLSFALDIGASYSFGSEKIFERFAELHPDWPTHKGAIGYANIWGWVPGEENWPLIRVPEIRCGSIKFMNTGLVCPSYFFQGGMSMMEWYSHKTARPVDGFFGPNVFMNYRLEIDYINKAVYLQKSTEQQPYDMDLVGFTLRPELDGSYSILGIADIKGKPSVEGVFPGDILIRIDDLQVRGATMGTVIDALRGNPGEIRTLELERDGKRFKVEATVHRFL